MLTSIRTLPVWLRVGLATLVALLMVAVIGVLAASHDSGRAQAAVPAAQKLSTEDRALCIKEGTGAPQSLWLVDATGDCPAGFWGPASLKDAFGIDIDAIVKAEVTRQLAAKPRTAPAPVDDAEETAPVLSISGAAGALLVNVKWTVPGPAADEKIVSYVLQYREHDKTTWTEKAPVTLPKATVNPLTDDTSYDFRVRAEYKSGGNGPWSNVLTVKTAEV